MERAGQCEYVNHHLVRCCIFPTKGKFVGGKLMCGEHSKRKTSSDRCRTLVGGKICGNAKRNTSAECAACARRAFAREYQRRARAQAKQAKAVRAVLDAPRKDRAAIAPGAHAAIVPASVLTDKDFEEALAMFEL